MREVYNSAFECFGCGACVYTCQAGALKMRRDTEGFDYPVKDKALCKDCGGCSEVCPAKKAVPEASNAFYALRCHDPGLLYKSTSGGAFSLIASRIIQKGGLVCGAVFDDSFKVCHILSDDISGMRKSKYPQSSLSGCFAGIKEALATGKPVLFTGCGCQCHAVRLCFPESEGLLTAALICRGVISPELWEEYIRYLEKDKGEITDFCFRDKRVDNDAHTVSYTAGGVEHISGFLNNPFTRIYLKELPLRPACYHCPYCGSEKPFDFTIGDFWGAEKVFPEYADGKGMSLVITNGRRAEEILREISGEAFIEKLTKKQAVQPALESPAKHSYLRRFLFKDFADKNSEGHCDMQNIIKKYGF